MNQQSNCPIDLELLNEISLGDIAFEIEVLQVYVEDIMPRIDKAREAIANNDYEQIMSANHHIKGASSNVGAWQMLALAVQLEKLDRVSDLASIPELSEIVDNMIKEMQAIEQFIIERPTVLK